MNDRERLAAHEAAHASAAVALGLPVLTVSIEPDDMTLGRVRVIYRDTPDDQRKWMQVILAAFIETGPADGIPSWPLAGETTDERNLRSLATKLESPRPTTPGLSRTR